MSMTRRGFMAACVGLGVVAVAGHRMPPLPVAREHWYLFGTLVDVTLGRNAHPGTHDTLAELASLLQGFNDDWHPWKPGVMGDINRAMATGRHIRIDAHTADMIRRAQAQHVASNGLFNPAIGQVVARWGFHGADPLTWSRPEPSAIEQVLRQVPTPLDVTVKDRLLSCTNPYVQLDLGGFAKGYALDLGRRLLAGRGVESALLNAGGDLVTLGRSPAGDNWRVAVRHPQRSGMIAWLETSPDEAVFTSGNYERYREADGKRYPHIIDPRTGSPVNGIASATVVHQEGATADAAATALVVAGMEGWRETAERMRIDTAMVVDGEGRMAMTAAMRERMTA